MIRSRPYVNHMHSSHQLAIEVGRYKKIPLENRKCKICKSDDIENEIHFALECTLYAEERKQFLKVIENKYPNFHNLQNKDKFIWLMSNENSQIISDFASYIYKCFMLRKTLN